MNPGGKAKRALDVTGSALGLLLLSPVFLVVALLVRLRLGSPVLFRQTRPGLAGRPFVLLKFRTMRAPTPGETEATDAVRVTPLGRRLRAWSLDELPELWNVLRGDMSLVGPRPLLPEYLDRYTAQQARRHEARPGITGWAQVHGRNALDWDEKFRLDVWYVDHRSLGMNLKILALTPMEVLRGRGVSHDGHATMPRFVGNGGGGDGREEP